MGVSKMPPDDIFYSSTQLGLHLEGLRRKQEKMCSQSCRFTGGFTRDSRGYTQKKKQQQASQISKGTAYSYD